MSPRILQLSHDYEGPFASITEQYAGCFSDCDVTTVFLRGPRRPHIEEPIHGDVIFMDLPEGALRGLKLNIAKSVAERIKGVEPNLVIAHRYKPFFIAQQLNRSMSINAILGVMHEYGFLKRTTRALYSHFWKDNVHLAGVSQPVCDEVIERRRGLKDRVHYLPHAIRAPTLLDSVSARHELNLPLGVYCYGSIGRLVQKKNQQMMIEAHAVLDDDSILALVGDGRLRSDLEAQARAAGTADRVFFCGHHDDARRLMKAFDAFVFPSGPEEAFGLVLLEAMAASLPIVCADVPGPRSVVGDCAEYFPSDNVQALRSAMQTVRESSPSEMQLRSQKGLERLGQEFSIVRFMERLRGLPVVADCAPITEG